LSSSWAEETEMKIEKIKTEKQNFKNSFIVTVRSAFALGMKACPLKS
jgi:hypothetical protein